VTKAIFTTKIEPSYDDLPEERYHFPRTYLSPVEAAVGDWIVYYKPRRSTLDVGSSGGRQAYFATARVQRIARDPSREDHFYAFVSDYLEFDRPVPFREGDFYSERALQRDDGRTNKGAFGRAVRNLSDLKYDLILKAGFVRTLLEANLPGPPQGVESSGFEEESEPYERPTVEMVVARPFREAAFAASVKYAYAETCAFTGLRIINGAGAPKSKPLIFDPLQLGVPTRCAMGSRYRERFIGCSIVALFQSMRTVRSWWRPAAYPEPSRVCLEKIAKLLFLHGQRRGRTQPLFGSTARTFSRAKIGRLAAEATGCPRWRRAIGQDRNLRSEPSPTV